MHPVDQAPAVLGMQLRRQRVDRGLSLSEVADRSGLSKGFLSQVERGLASPSVASLFRLSEVLGISVASMFEPSSTSLIRRDERPKIAFGGEDLDEWVLTPAHQRDFQVIESLISPGGGSGDELYSVDARSCWVYVIKGALELTIEAEQFRLEEGDAFDFPASSPHAWVNPSTTESSQVLWVLAAPYPGGFKSSQANQR